MHVVDHDPAELVDDQVHPAHPAGDQRRCGLTRVEGDLQRAGEVVARAERDQGERAVGQLVATVEGSDDRVQAAVAARHDDVAAAGTVQHAVELAGVARPGDLDVDLLAQHPEGDVEGVALAAAGLGVGDQQ